MKWYIMAAVAFFVLIICVFIHPNPQLTQYELLPFSSKARFQPIPDDVDVPDIPEDNPNVYLQRCKVNDINSCKHFSNTVCEHLDKDTRVHYNFGSNETILKKHKNVNDGYCMNIFHLSKRCNTFHGYWALIKKTNEDYSYMRVCICYRPGYIGNLKLFDACETPFICNGNVVNINTTFDQIECVCKKNEETTFIKNEDESVQYPVCTPKAIKSVTNWASILVPPEVKNNLIDSNTYYDSSISSNIGHLNELIDPCSICPLTGQQTGAQAVHALKGTTVMCVTKKRDWGIPFQRNNLEQRLLKGNFGPDGVLAVKWDKIIVEDNQLPVNPQSFKYVISPCEENKKFYDTLNIEYKQFVIDVGPKNFLSVTILPHASFIPRLFGYADGSWSMIKSGSIAHAHETPNFMDHFDVNGSVDGNIVSSVARCKPSLNTNSGFEWSTSLLVAQQLGDFEYLTYNKKLKEGTVGRKIDFKGFCIRPATDEQIHNSHWTHHKLDTLCYFVDFLVAA